MPQRAAGSRMTYQGLTEAGHEPRSAARVGASANITSPSPRRTVIIRGQVVDRYSPPRRTQRTYGPPRQRSGALAGYYRPRPERAAKWAVLLGFVLVVVALLSAHL